jgi:hypothetical protein
LIGICREIFRSRLNTQGRRALLGSGTMLDSSVARDVGVYGRPLPAVKMPVKVNSSNG